MNGPMIPALVPALSALVASVHVSVFRRLLENHHCQGEKDHSHTSGLSEKHTGAQFESAVFHSQDGPGGHVLVPETLLVWPRDLNYNFPFMEYIPCSVRS